MSIILFLIPLWCHLHLFSLFQMLLMLKLSVVSCSLGRKIILICHQYHGIIWEMNIGHMIWKKRDYWNIQHFRSGREEKLLCTVHSSPKAVVTWTRWVKAFHYSCGLEEKSESEIVAICGRGKRQNLNLNLNQYHETWTFGRVFFLRMAPVPLDGNCDLNNCNAYCQKCVSEEKHLFPPTGMESQWRETPKDLS